MSVERRFTRGSVEFRAAPDTTKSPGTLTGYALKFNTFSQNLGGFVETIAPGAVDKSIADQLDVLARYNHEDDFLLGRTASGTLRLSVDEVGLLYEVDLPNTQAGRDVALLCARGDVYQSSFAFMTIADEWGYTDQGFPMRTLLQVKLVDVAPVNTPAYLDTSSALRSLAVSSGLGFDEVVRAAEENRLSTVMDAPLGAVMPQDGTDAVPADGVETVVAEEHPLNDRQRALEGAIEGIVEVFGQFDQSAGPNGAHYMPDNPFSADGVNCAGCTFYDGRRACEVVAGDIAPDAVCKFWIIPSDLLSRRSAEDCSTDAAQGDTHASPVARRQRLADWMNRRTS